MPRYTTCAPMSQAPTMLSMQVCVCVIKRQIAVYLYAPLLMTPNPWNYWVLQYALRVWLLA